jgi:hypothetical protein
MTDFNRELNELSEKYQLASGKTWNYFFCPILCVDEETDLMKGHIINQALPLEEGDIRGWTIQRKDVDNFYGTIEADYVLIQYSDDELFEKTLFQGEYQFKPNLTLRGKDIGYYVVDEKNSRIPDNFTLMEFHERENVINTVIKMPPTEVEQHLGQDLWAFNLDKDISIEVTVSLIKAAHLTLFALFGYGYALSAAGFFIGYDILGKFFKDNKKHINSRKLIIENAKDFFKECKHLAAPVDNTIFNFRGTLNDKMFLMCRGYDKQYWGIIIFIKTFKKLHGVLLPLFSTGETINKYLKFTKMEDNEQEIIEVQVARFIDDKIEIDTGIYKLTWTKT